jgi:S-phase kinase-associated protein 1
MASASKSDKRDNKEEESKRWTTFADNDNKEEVTGDITFVSKDGQLFVLPKKIAYLSKLVKLMCDQDKSATQLDISVPASILESVVSYLNHHQGVVPPEIKKPLRSLDLSKVVSDVWDASFINKFYQQELHDIIIAANYMDIPPLLHLGCAKIASVIKGKDNSDVKRMFERGEVGFVQTTPSATAAAAAAGSVSI